MSQLADRIAQFRKMASDDPENELGHFRLGQLLMEAGEHDEAVKSFRKTLELSPQFSKVYQLLGSALMQLERRDEAIETLKKGHTVAGERGDRLPMEEMARLLTQLGETPPASAAAAVPAGTGDGFPCSRPGCQVGSYARQLPKPPLPDEIGKRIHEKVCSDCWNMWFRDYSVKVINEMRLDLSTDRGQETYDQIMREFLGLDEKS